MRKVNKDNIINIILPLFIMTYVGKYFLQNIHLRLTFMMIQYYLVIATILCFMNIKYRLTKVKGIVIISLCFLECLVIILQN